MKELPATRIKPIIEEFLSKQRSKDTIRPYRRHLSMFSDWLTEARFISGDQFRIPGPGDIQVYMIKLYDDGISTSARAVARSAIWSWFQHLGREGYIKINPVSAIKRPKLQEHLYRPLSEGQVDQAFASISEKNSSWPDRDRALFESIYQVGLTRKETCALNVADVELSLPALSVDGQSRPIDGLLIEAFRIYFAERTAQLARHGIDPKATPALFISERKSNDDPERRLGPDRISVILRGIDPAINPRKLRDACGIHMLNRSAEGRLVAAHLRVGISAIPRLKKLATKLRREKLATTHPRARLPEL